MVWRARRAVLIMLAFLVVLVALLFFIGIMTVLLMVLVLSLTAIIVLLAVLVLLVQLVMFSGTYDVDFNLSLSRRYTSSTSVQPSTDFGLSVELLGFGGGSAAGAAKVCRR